MNLIDYANRTNYSNFTNGVDIYPVEEYLEEKYSKFIHRTLDRIESIKTGLNRSLRRINTLELVGWGFYDVVFSFNEHGSLVIEQMNNCDSPDLGNLNWLSIDMETERWEAMLFTKDIKTTTRIIELILDKIDNNHDGNIDSGCYEIYKNMVDAGELILPEEYR